MMAFAEMESLGELERGQTRGTSQVDESGNLGSAFLSRYFPSIHKPLHKLLTMNLYHPVKITNSFPMWSLKNGILPFSIMLTI